jgi:acyl-CoA synthetase (AMP-forming)/AMP-acid ligase II
MSALPAEALPRVFPTVVHMLADTCARFPEATALVCGARSLSHAEYLRCVAGFAAELAGCGARGSRVALVCANSLDMPIAMFAAHAAGAQAVPINPTYTERELSYILEDAAPAAIIYDTDIAEKIEPLAAALGIRHRVHRRRKWAHPRPMAARGRSTIAAAVARSRGACDLAIHRRHHRPAQGRQHQPRADGRKHQPAGSRIADTRRR